MTKEKTIFFPAPVDKVGGAICGILLAVNLVSCIIISLYIAPATKDLYNLREEDKIIFQTDEAYLKTYSKFIDFGWQEFLEDLESKEEVEEVKREEASDKINSPY